MKAAKKSKPRKKTPSELSLAAIDALVGAVNSLRENVDANAIIAQQGRLSIWKRVDDSHKSLLSRDEEFDAALKDLIEQLLERETQTRAWVGDVNKKLEDQALRIDRLVEALRNAARPLVPQGWNKIENGTAIQAVMAGHIKGKHIDGVWYVEPTSYLQWFESKIEVPILNNQR